MSYVFIGIAVVVALIILYFLWPLIKKVFEIIANVAIALLIIVLIIVVVGVAIWVFWNIVFN